MPALELPIFSVSADSFKRELKAKLNHVIRQHPLSVGLLKSIDSHPLN